ncbi:cytochrome c biogenesis factor-like protein [Ketogulonicigenium robustum]|uniref:Cytochrome c biogenesis factor-like protein n=1 Tax=Ketogulonicigenium robustum TaxID=92947 RepID=A0A1W6P0G9_9RHOB|nr:c-type cytochrome biogenesis protein CcmI [Ketogulonicigenium robustum]ARO14767.1 cytochrome c biogenesis factor-like protein [Ketogulonicigenium robustum]
MMFWIVALLMVLIVTAGMVAPLLRRVPGAAHSDAEDITIYRQQLSEVDRDLARGTLLPEEAERTRTEISRRILAADVARARPIGSAPRSANAIAAVATLAVLLGGTALVYFDIGSPDRGDQPFATRINAAEDLRANLPSQATLESEAPAFVAPADAPANYETLQANLLAAAQDNPDVVENWQILALFQYRLGAFAQAADAMEKIIEVKGGDATLDDRLALLETMISAAGGHASAEVRDMVTSMLASNPDQPGPIFYQGLVDVDVGRADLTFAAWRAYIEGNPLPSAYTEQMRSQLPMVAELAGVRYTPPELVAPTAADIMAMSPEQQRVAIENMVDSLGQRLANAGGPPDEWAQLVRALRTLGRTQQAANIVAEARRTFTDDPDAVAIIEEAGEAPVGQLP